MQYEISQSRYSRGMSIIACPPEDADASMSDVARLACAFSGNRYSTRERGFLVSAETLKNFSRAVRLGCKSEDGATVEWESQSRERFYRFSAKHPATALRCIAREA